MNVKKPLISEGKKYQQRRKSVRLPIPGWKTCNVLSSIEWNEKKEKKEKGKGKGGGEETIGEKIRSIMAVKRHVTRSFRLIETVTL